MLFFPNKFLHSHCFSSLFHHWCELHFISSNLHLHEHNVCYVSILDWFIPVVRFNLLISKLSTLLDKSLRVLQLQAYISNSTTNG